MSTLPQLSFCAERSGVAESMKTEHGPCDFAQGDSDFAQGDSVGRVIPRAVAESICETAQ